MPGIRWRIDQGEKKGVTIIPQEQNSHVLDSP
jgi:hypothetical protein